MFDDRSNDSLNLSRKTDGKQPDFQRIEVITGVARRRRWSNEDKALILSESFAPGASVSGVARKYGLVTSQIYVWRKQFPFKPSETPSRSNPDFVPLVMTGGQAQASTGGSIEVMIGEATVRVNGAVDSAALTQVLAAVRRMS